MDILRKYFYGKLDASEEAQVQKWLVEHADEPEVVQALEDIMSEQQEKDFEKSSKAFEAVSARLGIGHRRDYRKIISRISGIAFKVAACLLLPLLGAWGYSLFVPEAEAEWLEVKVPNGKTDELILADGTILHLNAGSRVTYPTEFYGDERRIFVEGEVFAEVAKNPEKPFVIVSGDVDVEVLGTTFNLKSYNDTECVELLLVEGAVRMDIDAGDKEKEFVLHSGEMIQYDRKSGAIELKNFDNTRYRAFHEGGSIHFFNIRLCDITSDLERIFGTKIVIMDESLADLRYFAWFTNNESLEQILQSLNANRKMKFLKKNDVIYISKNN